MNAAQYLIDTSALALLLHDDADQYGWDQAAAALVVRAQGVEDMRQLFGWVPVDDRAYDRAWQLRKR